MPASQQVLSYPDIQERMDQALQSEKGIAIDFGEEKDAKRYLARCNSFRKLCRSKNQVMYPDPGHPLHHECIYDALVLRLSKDHKGVELLKPAAMGNPTVREL